jgi:hypothetical protein
LATVFISHRDDDAVQAARLAKAIEAAGHIVRLDAWEIKVGDSIIQFMNDALTSSNYLVLGYSADGVNGPWISREWMPALAAELETRNIKILPVRLSGTQGPAILADRKYADLTRNFNVGVAALLAAIR